MNLMEFAVGRKMRQSDPLLEYVAKGQPVPINILESSLTEILAPLADAQASHLVTDYVGMLQAYVPTTHTVNPETGRVQISGSIPDDLLETINIVHNVESEQVISQMIEASVGALSRQEVRIKTLDLSALEEAAQIAMPEVQRINTDSVDISDIVAQGVKEMQEAIEAPASVIKESVVEAPVQEAHIEPAPVEDFPTEDDTPEFVESEDDVETDEESEERIIARAAKVVYNRILQDFADRGLDTRLGLNFEPAV